LVEAVVVLQTGVMAVAKVVAVAVVLYTMPVTLLLLAQVMLLL
jgi:hypothetical protein